MAVQLGLPRQAWEQPPPSQVKSQVAPGEQDWEQPPPWQATVQLEPEAHCWEQPPLLHTKSQVASFAQLQLPSEQTASSLDSLLQPMTPSADTRDRIRTKLFIR